MKPKDKTKKQIFLVEDHPVTREGFAQLLNYQSDMQVCGEAGSAKQALVGIHTTHPDLVIIDLTLNEGNGIDLIKDIRAIHEHLPILVFSTHDESLYAERVLRAGAQGYVMKQAPTNQVMTAIRQLLRGEIFLSETMRTKLVHQHLHGATAIQTTGVEALSNRELEIFRQIGVGKSTRQIAADLNVSVSTIETHRAHIKEKLGLRNASELMRRAVEWTHCQADNPSTK